MPVISKPYEEETTVTLAATTTTTVGVDGSTTPWNTESAKQIRFTLNNTGANALDAGDEGGDLEGSLDGTLWFEDDTNGRSLASGSSIAIEVDPCSWRFMRFRLTSAAGTDIEIQRYEIKRADVDI